MKNLFLIIFLTFSCLFFSGVSQAADYAVGGGLGTQGVGVSLTTRSNLKILENDQFQWHFLLSGYVFDDADEILVNQHDYKAGSLQVGINWYPSNYDAMKGMFLSTGIIYFENELESTAGDNQEDDLNNLNTNSNQGTKIKNKTYRSSLDPYLGLGWGNRLKRVSGFSFRAEIGALLNIKGSLNDDTDEDLENGHDHDDHHPEKSRVNLIAQLDICYQF